MSRVSLQTLLDRSDKNMANGTHKVVRESALELIKRAYKEDINVQISEGHRSNARQNQLYAQGRTTPGNIVTNARAGQSWHNYGIAVDFFLTSNDGNKALWTVNKDWRRAAQIGKSLGFTWGGDWDGFVDNPHLQMSAGLSLSDLRAGKRPKLTSKINNKTPAPSKQPDKKAPTKKRWTEKQGNWTGGVLKQGQKGEQVTQLQNLLAAQYFYPEKGAKNNGVDGYYGTNTVNAVRRYQSVNGLTVDGIAGKATYNKLKTKKTTSNQKPITSNKLKSPTGTFGKGSKGDKVRQLQRALNKANYKVGKVDGDYGAKTYDAVKRLQSMYEINAKYVDGTYGPRTKKYLDKLI